MGPAQGKILFDITDVLGRDLSAKVELLSSDGTSSAVVYISKGRAETSFSVGRCKAFVYVYDRGIPILVDVQRIEVSQEQPAYVLVSLLEGSSGNRPLLAFDRDRDMVLDRVEAAEATDPDDAGSFPGTTPLVWQSPILSSEARWYRGELHAHSSHGRGTESVAKLIRRAEKLKLDFLAIADRNTLAASLDPDFKSKSVVLIPAMEWGNDAMGVGLIFAPRTFPETSNRVPEAQATCIRVQAQGGIFAIAHPCFPTSPWQWNLSYVNAVETWCRDWRRVPPMTISALDPRLTQRKNGRLIHSIAIAGATRGHSANGQAALFWDLELTRGLKASAIGGSNSASPKVPLAEPVTYVFAYEKSLNGILDGLRRGRTFISASLEAPVLTFRADVGDDGRVDTIIGGFVPLDIPTRFIVEAQGARGLRLEILLNGLPIRSTPIDSNQLTYTVALTPQTYSVYRARIVGTPKEQAFGSLEMLAMTGPIYAQLVVPVDSRGAESAWVNIDSTYGDPNAPDVALPEDRRSTGIGPSRGR